MDLNKVKMLANKLATPNDVAMVSVGENSVELLKTNGDRVADQTYKEFEALEFKEKHPPAPRRWRTLASQGKEF